MSIFKTKSNLNLFKICRKYVTKITYSILKIPNSSVYK